MRSLEIISVWTSRICEFITLCSDLRLGCGSKQTCSSPWEHSNDVSHSTCTHRNRVVSQLLMVKSQIANLTSGSSFCHNLCCRCPNGSTRPFLTSTLQYLSNDMKNASRRGVLTLAIELWSFGSLGGFPSPHFGSVSVILTLSQKWGCDMLHILGNISTTVTTLLETSPQLEVCTRSYGLPKCQESQFREFWESQVGSPKTKWHLDAAPMANKKKY
jgi:hypothetical protein